jgi:hypothetical protein
METSAVAGNLSTRRAAADRSRAVGLAQAADGRRNSGFAPASKRGGAIGIVPVAAQRARESDA